MARFIYGKFSHPVMELKQRLYHFRFVAEAYDRVRDTDSLVADYLGRLFSNSPRCSRPVLDLATGTARYPLTIANSFGIPFVGVDQSKSMLAVAQEKVEQTGAPITLVEGDCQYLDGILDPYRPFSFVTMFNALHHFSDIPSLADTIRCELAREPCHSDNVGRCYFYTRVGSDNERTIWGRFFPEFIERETHYLGKNSFSLCSLRSALSQGGLAVQECVRFIVPAEHTMGELLNKVRSYHFSTFRAYTPDELERASAVFSERIHSAFPETRKDHGYHIKYFSPMTLVTCTTQ